MYVLHYDKPAEDSPEGWEKESLPLGCGYFGVSVFGGVEKERLQFTENSFENDYAAKGLTDAFDVYLSFPHSAPAAYERSLDILNAKASVQYEEKGVVYRRDYFTSYPDRVMGITLSASQKGKLSFTLSAAMPYIRSYGVKEGDGAGREGSVFTEGNDLCVTERLFLHNVILSARVTLLFTDGCAKAEGNALTVTGATTAALLISLATNYRLSPELFFTECPKLEERDPMPLVKEILDKAKAYSIEELYERHLKDYRSLFDTADIFLSDGKEDHRPTNERLKAYEEGQSDTGLEELYFRYGRYLLICSSRKGCLPPNLQGIWAGTDGTPWGSGYWHNINIQMNYWPAFRTGLASLFVSYADYFKAFLPKAREYAYAYVRSIHPRAAEKDKCGYLLSTGAYAYSIEPFTPTGHSGPGTMGLTTKLFWEYYDYTQDETLLRETVYPVLLDTVRLYTKSVVLTDGLYLASHSASPEQTDFMTYPAGKPWNPYYHLTVGCAFDSQMIYESGKDFLKAEAVLGLHSAEGETVKAQLPFYDPVVIGASGQIKEFREETFYGEYGEYRHRHISQLVGLFPGSSVNKATPAYMDAAKVTLDKRGDESTGWALAHRLCAWAKTGDGNRAYSLLRNLLGKRTYPNLWDAHPPFQIDGNFGAAAGYAEMLLSAEEGVLYFLPALPDAWDKGAFRGLCASGGYKADAEWENGTLTQAVIYPAKDGILSLCYPGISRAEVRENNFSITFDILSDDRVSFAVRRGKAVTVSHIPKRHPLPPPVRNLSVDENRLLTFESDFPVRLYYANDSSPAYTLLADGITENAFRDDSPLPKYGTTYRAVSVDPAGNESLPVSVRFAVLTDFERAREKRMFLKHI